MTVEDIKKEIERMQDVAKDIKVSVGNLRSDINQLEGAIKQDNNEFEARLAEAENRGFQKGYEKGFAEGRKQEEEHDGCVGCFYEPCGEDEEPCVSCKYRYKSQYRRADDKIRVGDEVIAAFTDKNGTAVVTKVNNKKEARYIYADGTTGWDDISELKKTGRHFPEVEKVLEAMRQ